MPPAPAALPAPQHPHSDSSDPRPLTGSGAEAPTTLLTPQSHSVLSATLLLLLQTCRHRTATRRHRLGTAPALSMLGVVVPSRRLPAQQQGGTSALGLQLPRAYTAKKPLMGINSAARRPESPPPRSCGAVWGGNSGGDLFRLLGLGLAPGHGPRVEAAPRWWPLWELGVLVRQRLQEAANGSGVRWCPGVVSVSDFVELIAESIGHLDSLLLESVDYISLNEVGKAEGILLQVKNALDEGAGKVALQEMMMKFYQVIYHKTKIDNKVSKKLLYRKQDLCQIIRNMLTIHETNTPCPNPSSLAKYTLRCKTEAVDSMSYEFPNSKQQMFKSSSLCDSLESWNPKIIFKGHRNLLFCVIDAWLLAICDVALGSCLDLYEDYSLNNAPSGYNSVHGVYNSRHLSSGFEDDEFVEKLLQIKIRYVVKFCNAEVKSISACYWDGTGAR
ncbi:LOW QUALITY PROTEIN: protein mono-ADP-ribosyltransferase PARP4 [Amazona ochrocephala]